MTGWPLLIGLAVALQAPAPGGPGGASPRFLVVPLAGVDEARVTALYAGLEASGASGAATAERAGVDRPVDPAAAGPARVDEARAALLEARTALRELQMEGVDAALERAFAAALRLSSPLDHADLVGDILLMRAEIALARGRALDAERDLRLLARVDPAREALHPGVHPPALVRAFTAAREANAVAGAGYLALRPEADGAEIELLVDGARLVEADARAGLSFPIGPHFVTARAPGRMSHSAVVNLEEGTLTALAPYLPIPGAGTQRAAAIAALRAGGDVVEHGRVLLALSGTSALLLASAAGHEVVTAEGAPRRLSLAPDASALEIARGAVAALRTPDPVVVVDDPKDPRAPPPDPPDIGPEPEAEGGAWVTVAWVAGGAAVVAVVAATTGVAIWAFTPGDPPPAPPRPVVITGFGPSR
jgi:hypothetical protein